MENNLKKYMHIWLNHFAVHLKLTQCYKSTKLQLEKEVIFPLLYSDCILFWGLEAESLYPRFIFWYVVTLLVVDMLFEIWDMLCPLYDFLGDSVVKNLPAKQETWVWPLGQEDLMEKELATHSSVLLEKSHR